LQATEFLHFGAFDTCARTQERKQNQIKPEVHLKKENEFGITLL
jgi:hypothetical protein